MIKNSISVIFRISVIAFLLGGVAIVALQTAGLVLGDGGFVTAVDENVAPWVYGASGVSGLLAFALSYFTNIADSTTVDGAEARPLPEHA